MQVQAYEINGNNGCVLHRSRTACMHVDLTHAWHVECAHNLPKLTKSVLYSGSEDETSERYFVSSVSSVCAVYVSL